MKLLLTDQKAKIAHYNPRAEVHGESREAAADLKVSFDIAATFMNQFFAGMHESFFYRDAAKEDLADQGTESAPHLRYPDLVMPLKLSGDMKHADVKLHLPSTEEDVLLSDITVNNAILELRQGGTLNVSLRLQFHPSEEIAGKLSCRIGDDVVISIASQPEPVAGG